MKCSLQIWLASGVLRAAATVLMFCAFATLAEAQAAAFKDNFANRESIFTTNGTLIGTNITATIEANEPRHGGKAPSHSIWITWVAPTNGIATFDTHGSSFDTTMSAYTLSPTNGTLINLSEEAENDDDPGAEPTSLIQIGAIAGRSYHIAVDGFNRATGQVILNWSFVPADEPPPIIVSTPNNQAAKQGDPVSLTVNMIQSGDAQLNWYFNNGSESIGDGTNYLIANLQPTNVGRYKLRVTVGNGSNRVRFFTDPVEVQINSEGLTNTLASDKLFDAITSPLVGENSGGNSNNVAFKPKVASRPGGISPPLTPSVGVVRGYSGSQVFDTTYATVDPGEPAHCSVNSGGSYWLSYTPPTNGTITLDTIGSSYNTVLEVYTYNGQLTSYTNLISIACDNDSISNQGPSRVSFQMIKARTYLIAVAGVNGAKGRAWLNYSLNTNLPAQPPTLQSLVATQTVAAGVNVVLAPAFTGVPPFKFSWRKNTTVLTNEIFPAVLLTNVTTAATANYTLTVTNDLGTLIITNPVRVVVPFSCVSIPTNNGALNITFPTATPLRYTIQIATNVAGPWTSWSETFTGSGENFSTNLLGSGTRFYRVRVD